MQIQSTIKKIKEIDLTQTILLTSLRADKQLVEQHEKRLRNLFKTDSPEEIEKKITNIIVRDNLFNEAMNIVVPCFEISLDDKEIAQTAERLKPQFPNAEEKIVESIAKRVITKTLVFNELAREWKIEVTDAEIRASLEQYYRISNESIRPFLEDKEKFEGIRNVMLEEKTANVLIGKFKHEINLKPQEENKSEQEKK